LPIVERGPRFQCAGTEPGTLAVERSGRGGEQAVTADLVQLAGHGRLVAAIGDLGGERLERRQRGERVVAALSLDRRDVDEADAVGLQRRPGGQARSSSANTAWT
jgi:hypothetical protein